LIQQFFADNNTNRAKGVDNVIKELAFEEVERKLIQYYEQSGWQKKNEKEKEDILNFVLDKYLRFLDGKQDKYEKASALNNKNPELDYYKLPRLDEAIKLLLQKKFGASEAGLKKLYHPSDIDIYPKSRSERLEDPNPPSKGWKNPMAMRTMYELRKLVNHLLESGKIDADTKVVVEMARELNDANKRWAIQTYQKRREEQNIEFAKAILGVAKEKFPNLNENDAENIDKVRLWWEQLENGDELYKEVKALKEDVKKYKLWKEQQCVCLYTGRLIKLTDLFDGTSFDFEHTIPISGSFDNSLSNLTICDSTFNRTIKKDKIPTELNNYDKDWNGYTAIVPRLQTWKEKVKSLKKLIDDNKVRTKKAQDPESKANLVKARHLLQFDLEYWDKKLKTFTLKEMPNWWKNSQLVDTQIISKYARAYLKTVFNRVDVQKGSVTSDFRKIFGIMGEEKKDRSKHSHHAKDAAVLTLIPGSARREDILKKYYEDTRNFRSVPYSKFNITHVQKIEDEVLVNHVTKDQTLNPTRKKLRKRGKVVYLRDKLSGKPLLDQNGKKVPMIMQGDAIRGALHKETYLGAIKVVERNEEGFAIKENGKYVVKQKDGEDEIWIVVRKPINDINIDKDEVVDKLLKNFIKQQVDRGKGMHEVVDFNNKPIRHLRCRVKAGIGFLSKEKALPIKKHIFESKHEHKKDYLVQNEENYLYLLYEGKSSKGLTRGYQIINLFDIAALKIKNIQEIYNEPAFKYINKGKGKNIIQLELKAIVRVGDKVILYENSIDELKDLAPSDLNKRIYRLVKFNERGPTTSYLHLQHQIEARPESELGKSDIEINMKRYQARLELNCDKFTCAIESVDFKIFPDGIISWIEKKNFTEKVLV
jgi:CRISPR-associated endonuclease Csn1